MQYIINETKESYIKKVEEWNPFPFNWRMFLNMFILIANIEDEFVGVDPNNLTQPEENIIKKIMMFRKSYEKRGV